MPWQTPELQFWERLTIPTWPSFLCYCMWGPFWRDYFNEFSSVFVVVCMGCPDGCYCDLSPLMNRPVMLKEVRSPEMTVWLMRLQYKFQWCEQELQFMSRWMLQDVNNSCRFGHVECYRMWTTAAVFAMFSSIDVNNSCSLFFFATHSAEQNTLDQILFFLPLQILDINYQKK